MSLRYIDFVASPASLEKFVKGELDLNLPEEIFNLLGNRLRGNVMHYTALRPNATITTQLQLVQNDDYLILRNNNVYPVSHFLTTTPIFPEDPNRLGIYPSDDRMGILARTTESTLNPYFLVDKKWVRQDMTLHHPSSKFLFSSDKSYVVEIAATGRIYTRRQLDGYRKLKEIASFPPGSIRSGRLSPDGKTLVVWDKQRVILIDLENPKKMGKALILSHSEVVECQFSLNGEYLLIKESKVGDQRIKRATIRHLKSGIQGRLKHIRDACFSYDGEYFLTLGKDKKLNIYSFAKNPTDVSHLATFISETNIPGLDKDSELSYRGKFIKSPTLVGVLLMKTLTFLGKPITDLDSKDFQFMLCIFAKKYLEIDSKKEEAINRIIQELGPKYKWKYKEQVLPNMKLMHGMKGFTLKSPRHNLAQSTSRRNKYHRSLKHL